MVMKKFCGCLTLQAGTLICGLLSTGFSALMIVVSLTCEWLHCPNVCNTEVRNSLGYGGVIEFLFSVFLIHGSLKESKFSLLPWIFLSSITVTCTYLMSVYLIFFTYYHIWKVLIGGCVFLASCIYLYGILGVDAYYCELRDRSQESRFTQPRNSNRMLSRPPSYSTAVVNSAFVEEKPPTYTEAIQKL